MRTVNFPVRHTAALYKENQAKELSLYTVIFGVVKCYCCPVDSSVFTSSQHCCDFLVSFNYGLALMQRSAMENNWNNNNN